MSRILQLLFYFPSLLCAQNPQRIALSSLSAMCQESSKDCPTCPQCSVPRIIQGSACLLSLLCAQNPQMISLPASAVFPESSNDWSACALCCVSIILQGLPSLLSVQNPPRIALPTSLLYAQSFLLPSPFVTCACEDHRLGLGLQERPSASDCQLPLCLQLLILSLSWIQHLLQRYCLHGSIRKSHPAPKPLHQWLGPPKSCM